VNDYRLRDTKREYKRKKRREICAREVFSQMEKKFLENVKPMYARKVSCNGDSF
jgi:hypothetical protein